MADLFTWARPFVHMLAPETAHNAAICALSKGLWPAPKPLPAHPALVQSLFGLTFKNPVGLAAGFDKNAVAVDGLLKQGFGFVEAGTVTPLAQPGNPKPRMFRLSEDQAVINRLGFNNGGLAAFVPNFSSRDRTLGVAGANIGKNKDQTDAAADYVQGLKAVYPYADYITINISSPNTQGLRSLQGKAALAELLAALSRARQEAETAHEKTVPLLLKIAPDLDVAECEDIAEVVLAHAIDGLIVSNTTVSRPEHVRSAQRGETGGLSGAPLFTLSTHTLKVMYGLVGKKIPLIGAGGISSPQDAYAKIRAGASLVQLYSALVYQGFGLVRRINNELPGLLARDGFSHIRDAVGVD